MKVRASSPTEISKGIFEAIDSARVNALVPRRRSAGTPPPRAEGCARSFDFGT